MRISFDGLSLKMPLTAWTFDCAAFDYSFARDIRYVGSYARCVRNVIAVIGAMARRATADNSARQRSAPAFSFPTVPRGPW
jgi:hypothetical protein